MSSRDASGARRPRLNRDRVVAAAVRFADDKGVDALSMRALAAEMGVAPMAAYKHVADKDDLLDGMIDAVLAEVAPPADDDPRDWQSSVRARVLATRVAVTSHPWAAAVIESRGAPTPAALDHMESLLEVFHAGGVSADLAHHAMHVLGTRIWGFTHEVFQTSVAASDPAAREAQVAQMRARYPRIVDVFQGAAGSGGCDAQFEFELALDILLDGIARLHAAGWTSEGARERRV